MKWKSACDDWSPFYGEFHLYGPDHPVGQLQGGHSSRSAEGSGATLKSSNYPTIFPVLFNGEPHQVSESLD